MNLQRKMSSNVHRVLVAGSNPTISGIIATGVLLVVILICFVGIRTKACGDLDDGITEAQQRRRDRRLAVEVQERIHAEESQDRRITLQSRRVQNQVRLEEGQHQSKLITRQKRRECYYEFLKPFTMTAKENDFMEAKGEQAMPHSTSSSRSLGQRPHTASNIGRVLHWQLPTTSDGQLGDVHELSASCAICLAEYEIDDEIVRASEKECPHVFHHDCILNWLSTGKKRCPVCRNWFVPRIPCEELKKKLSLVVVPASETDNEESYVPQQRTPIAVLSGSDENINAKECVTIAHAQE